MLSPQSGRLHVRSVARRAASSGAICSRTHLSVAKNVKAAEHSRGGTWEAGISARRQRRLCFATGPLLPPARAVAARQKPEERFPPGFLARRTGLEETSQKGKTRNRKEALAYPALQNVVRFLSVEPRGREVRHLSPNPSRWRRFSAKHSCEPSRTRRSRSDTCTPRRFVSCSPGSKTGEPCLVLVVLPGMVLDQRAILFGRP